MPYFKDKSNSVHFLDDVKFAYLLPDESVEITDLEAIALKSQNNEQIKNNVWGLIKAERDRRKAGGVKVGNKWYHSDTESRIQHLGLKDQAREILDSGQPDTTRLQKLGQDIRWKTMDGSFIYMTVKHAYDIVSAVGDLDALAFSAAETHRTALEESANPESYDFSQGWPKIYGEA